MNIWMILHQSKLKDSLLLILMRYLCTVSVQNGVFSGPFNTTPPETTGSVPWYLHSWPIRCIIVSEMYHTVIPRWENMTEYWWSRGEFASEMGPRLRREKFEKGGWLKGSCTRWRTEQSIAGPLTAPQRGQWPGEQRGPMCLIKYRQIWSTAEHFIALALVTQEEGTICKWFK